MTKEAQTELNLEIEPRPLPPILTLEDFLAQLEREYGRTPRLDALRAIIKDEEPT